MYAEEEIRKANRDMGYADVRATRLLDYIDAERKKVADTDTITVREFREAYAAMEIFDDNSMLAYIREHREPDYPGRTPSGWMLNGFDLVRTVQQEMVVSSRRSST